MLIAGDPRGLSAGYSLVDDLLSGMGLAIGYGVGALDPGRSAGTGDARDLRGGPFPGQATVLVTAGHRPRPADPRRSGR